MYIESPADGYQARVDSEGHLLTRSDCSSREVTTTRGSFEDEEVVTLAEALEGCCSVTIQNRGTGTLAVAFEATDPVEGDYEIAAGQTFTVPFPYAGEIRGMGVGGGGTFVTLQARRAS